MTRVNRAGAKNVFFLVSLGMAVLGTAFFIDTQKRFVIRSENSALSAVNDFDGDGISDVDEKLFATNPKVPDTDRDGASDGQEVQNQTDPLGEGNFSDSIRYKMSGFIVKVGEKNINEFWYVDPWGYARRYLGDEKELFEALQAKSLGISDSDIANIPTAGEKSPFDDELFARITGKFVVQTQSTRQLWYIHPQKKGKIEIRDAYDIFSRISDQILDISYADLAKIPDVFP
ncbi:MAG: hypothetical protein HY453_02370 [Parcubacteria group bacterium]|nr:hypothetical protein [Parcubacteria group bacterium]